jgi:alanyl-tRNA synthetase
LYDTYGFPIDLTQLICLEKGIQVDLNGFESALAQQKAYSRQASKEKQSQEKIILNLEHYQQLPLFLSDYNDGIARGGEASVIADPEDKIRMARHHTATHLLQEALRQVLGLHIQQAGSLVDVHRLRFDFNHFMPLSSNQLKQVEALVITKIKEDIPLSITYTSLDKAKEKGAMALFGEKYDEGNVRLVEIPGFSLELCGGTHVKQTGLIENFKIIQETSSAAGIRRIEAIAGKTLIEDYENKMKEKILQKLESKKKQLDAFSTKRMKLGHPPYPTPVIDTNVEISALHELEKTFNTNIKWIQQQYQKDISHWVSQHYGQFESQISDNVLTGVVLDMEIAQHLSDRLFEQYPNLVIVLAIQEEEIYKVCIKTGIKSFISAQKLAQYSIENIGGSGGGKSHFAQLGNLKKENITELFVQVRSVIQNDIANET